MPCRAIDHRTRQTRAHSIGSYFSTVAVTTSPVKPPAKPIFGGRRDGYTLRRGSLFCFSIHAPREGRPRIAPPTVTITVFRSTPPREGRRPPCNPLCKKRKSGRLRATVGAWRLRRRKGSGLPEKCLRFQRTAVGANRPGFCARLGFAPIFPYGARGIRRLGCRRDPWRVWRRHARPSAASSNRDSSSAGCRIPA